MAAPKYKLTYFDVRGRGEISRLVFTAAQVPFEDCRIEFAQWPDLKPKTPLGALPMLEINGKKHGQGMAIATFLAREFGLYGSSHLDGLLIDQIQQQREDLLVQLTKVTFAKDEASKAENQKKLDEEAMPTTFKFFNEVIKNNVGGNGYAVGNKLSLADLVILEGTQFLVPDKIAVLDDYPEIKMLRAKIEAGDAIKKYLSTRKVTNI